MDMTLKHTKPHGAYPPILKYINTSISQAWWFMPAITALERLHIFTGRWRVPGQPGTQAL
jgi:hypothetical protein